MVASSRSPASISDVERPLWVPKLEIMQFEPHSSILDPPAYQLAHKRGQPAPDTPA